MEGSITDSLLGTHTYTLHHNITKFIAIAIITEFLVLFYTTFPKDFGEARQNCQKNACISRLNYSTWRKQGTSLNRLLCFSDVMFTCQGKFGEFMPASKLASTFVLAFIEGIFMPLNRQ